MLYGRLPTRRRSVPRLAKLKSSASASISSTLSGACLRQRAARSRSISMAARRGMRCKSASVKAPRPGPISTKRSPACGLMQSTMPWMICWSMRKCWPKRLRATCVVCAAPRGRAGGCFMLPTAPRVGSPTRPPWGSRKLGAARRFLESPGQRADQSFSGMCT